MKKINLFSMAAAFLLAATGCSDDIDNGGNKPGEPIDGNGVYLSVNIMTPSTSGAYTKAGEEETTNSKPSGGEPGDGYLSALEKENKVSGVTIVLYGKEGVTEKSGVQDLSINNEGTRVIASSYTDATEEAADDKYNHHTGKKATVRLNSEYLKTNTYYRILAIANANVTDKFVPGTSLADCKIKTIANDPSGTEGTFIMSTHVEENTPTAAGSTEEHSIVSFTNENIKENKPATGTVWVERLSARIDYVGTTFEFPIHEDGDQTKTKLATVTLEGVAPVNVATHNMYIFKQVADAADATTFTTLGDEVYTNDKQNYVIEPTTNNLTNKQFSNSFNANIIATINSATGQLGFKNFTEDFWKTAPPTTATDENRIICYAGENTMAATEQKHGNTTGVIFKAKYAPEKLWVYNDEGDTQGEVTLEDKPTGGFTTGFYRVNNKLYKELEAAEAELIFSGTDDTGTNPLVWLRKNFTKDTWTLQEGIDFATLKSAVATAAIGKKDLGYLKFLSDKLSASGVTAVNASTMNWTAFLGANTNIPANTTADNKVISNPNTFTIEYFGTAHTCYYPYWIRHANNGDDKTMGIMEFCIVRNNVYRLNVTGIDGLGMADPFDSTDKPDEGEEEGYYLKVELYVHDWVVRDNGSIILKPGN